MSVQTKITSINYSMLKTHTSPFNRLSTSQKSRPMTSITKRTIDMYANRPLHKQIKEAYQIHSVTDIRNQSRHKFLNSASNAKLDSQQPETVCSWLDEFENEMSKKVVGTSYQYPASKYQQSSNLIDSKGYRRVKNMKKQQILPEFVKQMREQLRRIHSRMDVTGSK